MNPNSDDFLKAVYHAELNGKSLSGTELARQLDITPSGVTRMAGRLKEEGFLDYRPYRSLVLTRTGRRQAAGLIRKHRLWEMFLHQVLGLGWNEVHREAEMLEHQTSDALVDRLDAYLGYPSYDPHGQPIPDREGRVSTRPGTLLLSAAKTGRSYRVTGVTDKSDALMDYFTDIGLTLDSHISLVEKISMDGSIIVSVKNHKTILSKTIADNIYVSENFE